MIRRPPRSTLFPTRRSSDLHFASGAICKLNREAGENPARPRHCDRGRSEEHTSELQSRVDLVCRLLLEKKKKKNIRQKITKKKKEEECCDVEFYAVAIRRVC